LTAIPFPLSGPPITNFTNPTTDTTNPMTTPNANQTTSNSTPTSTTPRYSAIQARGTRKKHGLAIVYDHRKFCVVKQGERVVRYDEESIRPLEGSGVKEEEKSLEEERKKRGGTRQTKNIGLVVGLEFVDRPGKGVIVGTTHL
jgi:hypothetical protein